MSQGLSISYASRIGFAISVDSRPMINLFGTDQKSKEEEHIV